MNAYRITGTYNERGAVGAPETFKRIIFADTPREAYHENRAYHYQKGREHVLTMEVQESVNNGSFVPVDAVYYL